MFSRVSRPVLRASLIVASLLVAIVGPSSGSLRTLAAQASPLAAPSTSLVSGITVQNLSSDNNVVRIQFFDLDGTSPPNSTITTTLAPFAQQTWYTPTLANLPPGFVGSAVVSGSAPVAAIFNIQTPSSTGTSPSDPIRVDTGLGADPTQAGQIGSTLYIPQIMRNYGGWNTAIYVQNAGSSDAQVTVTYRDRYGNPIPSATEYATIKPNVSHIFDQANNANLGTVLGSAVVTGPAGSQLAAVVNLFNVDTDNTNAQLLTYNASAAGGKKLYAPRITNNYYGFNSGLTIQNLDPSTSANVTITFFFGGQSQTVTAAIAPQAAAALYIPNVTDVNGNPVPTGVGSAVITSNVNISAIVNEDNRVNPSFIGMGSTYNAFVDGTQTTTAFMPQITSCYYGYASGITIQNVGSSAGSGTITLTAGSTSQTFPTGTIPANGTKVFFAPNLWASTNFNGSATVSFSQPIFAIANLSFRGNNNPCPNPSGSPVPAAYGDSFAFYNAINR